MENMDSENSLKSDEFVSPGQRLGHADDFTSGKGTYIRFQHIYASIVGIKQINQSADSVLPILSVTREREQNVVPEINSIAICKVLKVNPRLANVSILCVGTQAVQGTFSGIIRSQDVRATEIDKVEIYKCFRPGDIVRAEVISMGDSRSYYLSTARNELGVIYATSVAGGSLLPISWEEMICSKTNMKEFRKVAKIDTVNPINISQIES